jgi:hypothetical protein
MKDYYYVVDGYDSGEIADEYEMLKGPKREVITAYENPTKSKEIG